MFCSVVNSTSQTTAATNDNADNKTTTSGTLVMATNASFPPYEYYENEKIVGIDAEVAELIAQKLGMTLEIKDMEFGSIIGAVQTGTVDMGMAGMTVTEDRLVTVDFSDTYATAVQVIIVKEGSEIKTADDLEGKKIAMSIMLYGNHQMHYHLSGSLLEYRNLAPSNLLLYQAALWGYEHGFKTFHLGGGVGSEDDNLYKFKAAFNKNSDYRFSIGKQIFNSIAYDKLVELRKNSDPLFDSASLYFPLYRA